MKQVLVSPGGRGLFGDDEEELMRICLGVVLLAMFCTVSGCSETKDTKTDIHKPASISSEKDAKKVAFQYCTALGIDKDRDYVGTECPNSPSGSTEVSAFWKVKFANSVYIEVDGRTGNVEKVVVAGDANKWDIDGDSDALGCMPETLPQNATPASNLVGPDVPFEDILKTAERGCRILGHDLRKDLHIIYKSCEDYRPPVSFKREREVWAVVLRSKEWQGTMISIGVRSGDVYHACSYERKRAKTSEENAISQEKALEIGQNVFSQLCKTANVTSLKLLHVDPDSDLDGRKRLRPRWQLDDICVGDKKMHRMVWCQLTEAGEVVDYGDFTAFDDWLK